MTTQLKWSGEMQVAELIVHLNAKGIFPYVEAGKLKTRSKSNIEPELVAMIRAAKDELIAFLSQDDGVKQQKAEQIRRLPDDAPQALSFNQERLWLTNQIGGGSAQYNISQALRFRGPLKLDALQAALDALVERHEVLRTSFLDQNGVALQKIHPAQPLAVKKIDLTGQDSSAQEVAVSKAAQAEAETAFDLQRDMMLRVVLLALAPEEHVLIFTMHHIASDGWSMALLAKDFVHLYQAFSQGLPSPLPALPLRYIDYAVWQRNKLAGAALQEELKFWTERLQGIPKLHNLPLDRPRAAQQQFSGQRLGQVIERSLLEQLYQLCEAQGVTFFMLMQAAYACLLGRWSGDDDIVVGCPVAGRTQQELESIIGFFSNALIYRTDLSGDISFAQLLARVKANAIEVFSHQDVPFETLAKSVQTERSLAYSPVFQVSFTLQNNEEAQLDFADLAISHVDFTSTKTLFDLSLFARESRDGLYLSWLFSDQLFDKATIQRFAQSFAVLLRSIVANPQQKIAHLALVSEQDLALQLAWSQACQPSAEVACMHHVFEAQAAKTPNALAVIAEAEATDEDEDSEAEGSLSYAQLNEQANQLARYLRSKGVQADSIVGLCLERTVDLMIGVLGILKAGAAYLPLDPRYPVERLTHMLQDAAVSVVVTQKSLMSELPLEDMSAVLIDAKWRKLLFKKLPTHNLDASEVQVTPQNLAYVIYTSGSTGKPKGVMVEHAALVQSAAAQRAFYAVQASSVVLQYVSFSFDVAAADWSMALGCGACLCIANDSQRRDSPALAKFVKQHQATHMQLPAPVLAQLNASEFPSIVHLVVGGSSSSESVLKDWLPGRTLYNGYGPTEAVIACGARQIVQYADNQNIGRPFPHVRYRVVDEQMQLLPIGVPGQLLIGGLALARGYYEQPTLSAEKFVRDPFLEDGQARLYKSGDLVRYLANGEIVFLGRVDDQVKLRGYRIELGEVRAVLLQQEQVKEALVMLAGEGADKRLVAYLVPQLAQDAAALDAAAQDALISTVRHNVRQSLPEFMVPAGFAVLSHFPLTANGKIDTKALPAVAADAGQHEQYVAPSNAIEQTLCEIWQQLLKVEKVGVHDNFFALGGDSILSIQVVSRANQAGIGITTRQLFAHQTVAELALEASTPQQSSAPQQAVQGGLQMLPIQRYFLALSGDNPRHFNQSVLLQIPANLQEAQLRQIMQAVLERHDVLRLRLQRTADGWQAEHIELSQQIVQDSVCVEVLPAQADQRAAFITERCRSYQRSSDPLSGPMLRAVYFHTNPNEPKAARVFLIAHHFVVDGVSWRILLADFETAFGQLEEEGTISLAQKTSSFQQWGQAVHEYADSAQLAAQEAYWLQQMALPVPPLALLDNTPASQASTRAVSISLTEAETQALLKQSSFRYRTQINELLLSALYLAMRAWRGQDGVRIMLEGHGREDVFAALDVSQTLGWFTTTYPLTLLCDAQAAGSVEEVIQQVKEQYRQLPQHGFGYSVLRHIRQLPQLVAAEHDNPAQVVFNYLGQFDQSVSADTAFQGAPEATGEAINPERARHFPLGLNGKVVGGVLGFSLDYSQTQFSSEQIEQLAAHFGAALRSVIAQCAVEGHAKFTPSDFPLARVSRANLDAWQERYPQAQISKLYPATSMQQGMHFHSQLERSAYVSQCCPVLAGQLDPAIFQQAWQTVVNRYDIFRTVFVGEGDQLHQLVLRHAQMPWFEEDWRHLTPAEQAAQFEQARLADRARGFDHSVAPLQRMSLYRLSDTHYQLLWSHHHMLLDGWCTPIVYRDVVAAYQALARGKSVPARQVHVYENYIAWLQQQDMEQARAYWRQYLAPVDGPTPLQIDRPVQLEPVAQNGLSELRLHFDEARTAQLQAFAKSHKTTVNTLMQLAWGYLLHRYSGENHVVFGTTISGRPAEVAGVEEMVGLFINSIPVRVSFEQDGQIPSVAQLLPQLHADFQQCVSFGHLPLTQIAQCSKVQAGVSLYDNMLVFENYPLDASVEVNQQQEQPDFWIDRYDSFEEAGYRLTLSAALRETLNLKLRYATNIISDQAAARVMQHIETILLQLAAGQELSQLPMLGEDERQQLQAWNQTESAYPQELCLHQLFEQQAALHPQRQAVVVDGQSISYAQLNQSANRLAHGLLARGVQREAMIGLCAQRSLEMVIGLLAILKAGAAYVPLDPKHPAERLQHILQDSKVELVLNMSAEFAQQLPTGLQILDIASMAQAEQPESNIAPASLGLTPRHLAYVIYTSGSTGLPKGVLIEHRGVVNLLSHQSALFDLDQDTRFLHCASMSFDAGTENLFMTLAAGGCVYLVTPEIDLVGAMQEWQITHAGFPVSILEAQRRAVVPSLKTILVGGDVCPPGLVQYWASQCKFFNMYGPTECSVTSSCDRMLPGQLVTIGRTFPNVQYFILDAQMRQVPNLVAGFLYIGGLGLARAYLNQPELTAERFITPSSGPLAGLRLYNTGDVVRQLPDGRVEFIGRRDEQVKIRGLRIELGEIESKLQHLDSVREAVVVVKGSGKDKYLAAYAVAEQAAASGVALSEHEKFELVHQIKQALARFLPAYMVPAQMMVLDSLPLTANGKVDKAALPEPVLGSKTDYLPPRNDTERRVQAIWHALLGMQPISVDENFFSLGGNSLQISRLTYELRSSFTVELSVKALFSAPTIMDIATLIDALLEARQASPANDVELDDGGEL